MEFLCMVFLILHNCMYSFVNWILSTVFREKVATVPPVKNSLLRLTATTLAKKIRQREVSCEEVVKAYIDRINEVNPIVNAVIEDRFEAALQEAKSYDKKLKASEISIVELEKEKPLYGIPFTVKESCSLKGLSHTGCTLSRQGIKASEDSFIVESLKRAGAIPLCVTNTPELCLSLNSSNLIFGETKNPYDTSRTAGGSSGGEGALIGAGGSLIGVGSDIAGSIRIPAQFNGIFGHKPTPGIISIKGHHPTTDNPVFQKWLVTGPLARYAEDLLLTMKVMTYKCDKNLRLNEPIDLKEVKVFYLEDPANTVGMLSPERDIQVSIRKAVKYLEGLVSTIEECSLATLDKLLYPVVGTFFGSNVLPTVLEVAKSSEINPGGLVIELLKAMFGLSRHTKAAIYTEFIKDSTAMVMSPKYPKYKADANEMQQKFTYLLGENGVLIYPSFPLIAPFKKAINLESASSIYCFIWNVFGFPSTHIPMGLNRDGLPVGFQVIAAPYQDRLCLAVAKELEKEFNGWVSI